jgi:phage-related protein
VFKVLKSKQYVKLYYKGDYRNVWIEGYIESIDITYFEMKQVVTCAILCPFPYFKEAQQMVDEIKNIISAFHFPFASTEAGDIVFSYINSEVGITIQNDGDVDCGMIIRLYARNNVSDPKIFNYVTKEYIGLKISMEVGDLITLDTSEGEKTATLLRDGVEYNIFNSVIQGSTWLQLAANGDSFVYEVGTGSLNDLKITFEHENLFEGV